MLRTYLPSSLEISTVLLMNTTTSVRKNGMKNSLKTANVTYGPSWSFHDFGRLTKEECTLLDYIFTTDNIEVNRYRVIQDKPNNGFLSDHYPILVKLAFK